MVLWKVIIGSTKITSELYRVSSVAVESGMPLKAVRVLGLYPLIADMGIVFASFRVSTTNGGTRVPAGTSIIIETNRDHVVKDNIGLRFRKVKIRSIPGR